PFESSPEIWIAILSPHAPVSESRAALRFVWSTLVDHLAADNLTTGPGRISRVDGSESNSPSWSWAALAWASVSGFCPGASLSNTVIWGPALQESAARHGSRTAANNSRVFMLLGRT